MKHFKEIAIVLAVTVILSMTSAVVKAQTAQPGVQNQYPDNAVAGQKIVIITTVTSSPCALLCVTDYDEVIVNVLLPNSSAILSTAPASPAINTVTAPATRGPWSLVVEVLWMDPPYGGTMAIFQTTITIKIN